MREYSRPYEVHIILFDRVNFAHFCSIEQKMLRKIVWGSLANALVGCFVKKCYEKVLCFISPNDHDSQPWDKMNSKSILM